ncbi:acyl-CoA thioesterase family protein [Natronococcus wangiae]|uniref:acyl-ACP thioesterase domain-containing protein n=1 Tax=Natronococcus wangiae TaxID=3068275 RepID=UPI00273D9850|nr:acyl-ACP thioesterase domain-containing protein [Natronococcus sp. AD5]
MNKFNYVKNLAVRFGDLDTLGHVNNVAYVGYLDARACFGSTGRRTWNGRTDYACGSERR